MTSTRIRPKSEILRERIENEQRPISSLPRSTRSRRHVNNASGSGLREIDGEASDEAPAEQRPNAACVAGDRHDASDEAPAEQRPNAACVAGDRHDASDEAPAKERPNAACVAGERQRNVSPHV